MRKTHSFRQILSPLLFLGAVGLTAVSCTKPATEIVTGVTTQIQVPKELAAVGVAVRYGGSLVFCRTYPVHNGSVELPSTLGTAPQDGRDILEPVTVSVIGFRTAQAGNLFDADCVVSAPDPADPDVLIVRRARTPYVDGRVMYLPMPLKESCRDISCDSGETCIGGVCESMDVSA